MIYFFLNFFDICLILKNKNNNYKMAKSVGYIYVRSNISYENEDACKMGKTFFIAERDMQYATNEIKRGYFELVFEIYLKVNNEFLFQITS